LKTQQKKGDKMKTDKATFEKLEKVYLHTAKNSNANEAQNAKAKLETLCKKYKVDMQAFIAKMQDRHDIRSISEISEKIRENMLKSRRNFIIENVTSNVFDSETLAQAIKACFTQYSDISKNKKAITGTLYDMQKKYNYTVKKDSEKRIYCEKCTS
jgi:hypothetical protein